MEEEEVLERPVPIHGRVARGMTTEEAEEPEKKQRIKIWMGACMVIFALFIDLIELGSTYLVIGVIFSPIISIGTGFVFWLWFKLLGISYISNPKRLVTQSAQFIIEIIPGLDAIPILAFAWTIGTIITIIITRSEDKGGIISKIADTVPMPK